MNDPALVKPPAAQRGTRGRGATRGRGLRGTRADSTGSAPGVSNVAGPPPGSPKPPAPAPRRPGSTVAASPAAGSPSTAPRPPVAARKSSVPSVNRSARAMRSPQTQQRPVSTVGGPGARPSPPPPSARPTSSYGHPRDEHLSRSGDSGPSRANERGTGERRKLASSMYEGIAVPGGKAASPFNMAALKKELQDKHKQAEGSPKVGEETKKSEETKKKNIFAFRKGKDKEKEKEKEKDKGSWQYKYEKEKKAKEKAERLRSKAEDEKDRLVELVGYLYTALAAMTESSAPANELRASITDLHQQVLAKDAELGLELKEEEAVVEVKPLPNSRSLPRPPAAGVKEAARAATTSAKQGRGRLASSRKDSFNELRKINESRTNLRQLLNATMQEAATVVPKTTTRSEPEKPLTEEERKLRQRENTVNELVSTETQFQFDCAEMIIGNFMAPLKEVLSEEDLQAVFSNVEAIVPFSADLRTELTAITEQAPDNQMIGELFLRRMEEFYVFTQYCVNQPLCSERVKVLMKKNSQFRSVVEQRQAKPACQGLRLEDFLIKPVQRVCKYPLLLRAIVKATDESHPDHGNLTQAMQKMEGVLTGINATKASSENAQKIQEIESKFDELELQADGRMFIMEGSLKKAVFNAGIGEDTVTGRAMFLFSDILLLAKYQGKKLHMITVFPVEHCLVWDVTVKDKHAFQVMRTDKKQSIVCYCDSDKSKVKWTHNVNTAISDSFGAW